MTGFPNRIVTVEIDLAALADNVRLVRERIGPDVRFYAVGKGDAYGTGLERAAPVMLEAGADGLAMSDPADVAAMRARGLRQPMLLYPGTPPSMAGDVVATGAIVTLHDDPSLDAFAAAGSSVEAFVKVDCGFGRLGFPEADWSRTFERVRRAGSLRLRGIYTHLAFTEDPAAVLAQMERFRRAADLAAANGFHDLELMVASSRVVLGYEDLHLNAVNPGRLLYGILERPWTDKIQPAPVIRRISTFVIQVKDLAAGSHPGYMPEPLSAARRIAIVPAGFANGFPRIANSAPVLVHGRLARVLGMRSTEHMMIDVSDVPDVAPGDEVVLLGPQGDQNITLDMLDEAGTVPLIELLPRLARSSRRLYLPDRAAPGRHRPSRHAPATA
ncbi:MAG TPA: alanine racemase [Methylomirabilota bacterium]|nr:alanine racemase [Methylomirabilota bacterium]